MKNKHLPLLLASLLLAGCWSGDDGASSQQIAEATIQDLVITTTEDGTVEAEENVVISNELRWSVIIKQVVEEGTIVKEGELIIEFECKNLEDAIDQKTLTLNGAKLALKQAEDNLKMARKQQAFFCEQAENALTNAEQAQERYISGGGEMEKSLKDADRAIIMAEKRLEIEKEKLAFKKDVNKKPELNKPYSESEIESDELNVESLKNTLEKAREAKKLLIDYDIKLQKQKLETAVKEAKLNVEKTTLSKDTTLDMQQLEIESKRTVLEQHQEQMKELREDEDKLRVLAEKAGLVLYNPGWKGEGLRIQVKEGEQIFPRQKLLEIPDMTTLRVKTMLFEALKEYVKVEGGPKKAKAAEAVIDAHIKKAFEGLIGRIMSGALPKEKFKDEAGKIIIQGIVPKIKEAVTEGKMTKDEAKDYYSRLKKTTAETDGGAGLVVLYPEINWDELPDLPAAKTDGDGMKDQKGTEAMVVLDAFAQKTQLPGRVVESSPLPKSTGPHWLRTGTKAYDLYVGVDWEAHGLTPGRNLRPGMGGKVTLFLEEIKNALTIPVLSVYNKKNKYYCKKIVDGTPTETEIAIGKMNESRVAVLSGLKQGDKVLLIAKAEEGVRPGADGGPSQDDEAPEEGL